MPAASMGPENPLPHFRTLARDAKIDFDELRTPVEDREGFGWETGFRVLPYRMQDSYTRTRQTREFAALVLENDLLSVTVLPEIGGKVWSVVDKRSGRSVIQSNPVFQPANLALRNAWTSGGIEWNTPQVGHHYLTCSPVHAARIEIANGQPGIRLYAWERVKRFCYQIDVSLDPERPLLLAHVRIVNPHDFEMPMYWWTNIAVPEYKGGRVLCPAETAFRGNRVVNCADDDVTYPDRQASAYDLFFRVGSERRRWEMFVDADGAGLLHTSTRLLKGRKLFAWGVNPGSEHWNEFLSVPGAKYVEVQAGLGVTQSHSVRMPALSEWSWTEAIGPVELDAASAHDPDWNAACRAAEARLDSVISETELERTHTLLEQSSRMPPTEVLFRGSGWGYLETARSRAANEKPPVPESMRFDREDVGEDEAGWLALIESGAIPEPSPSDGPGHYMTGEPWRALLQQSVMKKPGDHWAGWFHLGVMQLEDGDDAAAERSFERSLSLARTGWALYGLGMLCDRRSEESEAIGLLSEAHEVLPQVPGIAAELARLLGKNDMDGELAAMLDEMEEDAKNEPLLIEECKSALKRGQIERAEAILNREFAAVYEGDRRLCELWWELQMAKIVREEGPGDANVLRDRVRITCNPPRWLDFRMTSADSEYKAPQANEVVQSQ